MDRVKLVVGDTCLGMPGAVRKVFQEAKSQRCTVYFYRNVFSVTPRFKVNLVGVRYSRRSCPGEQGSFQGEGANAVAEELRSMKLKEATKKTEDGIEETLTCFDFSSKHWTRIHTNNVIEQGNPPLHQGLFSEWKFCPHVGLC